MPIQASRSTEILPIDSPMISPKEAPAGGGGGGGGGGVELTVVMVAPQQLWRAILKASTLLLTIEISSSVGKETGSEPAGEMTKVNKVSVSLFHKQHRLPVTMVKLRQTHQHDRRVVPLITPLHNVLRTN